MNISIIIPTLNEVHNIEPLLRFFTEHKCQSNYEVIVVDGGSNDGTIEKVLAFSEVRLIEISNPSRARQMNAGAMASANDVFYFVHADVKLPESFFYDIKNALKASYYGGYRYQFDSGSVLLKINAFFTRFPMMWCRGGDQTLFITRSLFDKLDGFDERFCVMEDFDLLRRAAKIAAYRIIQKNVIVSARKYAGNGYLKVQMANLKAFRMFNKGVEPEKIRSYYKMTLGLKDY